MKYVKNPINKEIIKSKFNDYNLPLNRESLNYFSNKDMLLVDKTLINNFISATDSIGDYVREMLEKFKNGDFLEYYDFNDNIKEKIINSLNKDEIAFRCDWGLESGLPKLYEINAESCGFMIECSLIPQLIEENSLHKSVNTNLINDYVKKMTSNLNQHEKTYLMSLDYIYDVQNLHFLKNFYHYDAEIILISQIERIEDNLFYNGEKIKSVHKIYPWIWLIEDGEIDCFDEINASEPLWTLLFDSKIILYLLNKVFKSEILLETFLENQKNGKFIEKSFYGLQGMSNVKSNGLKKFSTSILQRRVNPIKINGDILNFSTWLVNKKFSGIGVKTDRKIISNHNHKFIPLAIE